MSIARRTLHNHLYLLVINIDDDSGKNCYGYLRTLKGKNSFDNYTLHTLAKTTNPQNPAEIDVYNDDEKSVDHSITKLLGFDYAAPPPKCWEKFLNMKVNKNKLSDVVGIIYLNITVDVGDTPH